MTHGLRHLPFIAVLAGAGVGALSGQGPSSTIVITRATVIDGLAPAPVRDATIVLRDGKIERIATGRVDAPAGATVVDLAGRWVLPGLIDAHVHLRDLPSARAALASGVTTARSLGVEHFADIGIRDLNRGGVANLPDVIASGYHVRPRPAEAMFLDLPRTVDLMTGVNGPERVRLMVRALIERGADGIKIMATERAGLPDTDPRKRVYSEEELAAAVDEAKRAGRLVAAHAHGDEGAAAAVRAGVRTIEHGTYLSDQTLALMKERGTCFVPTIATVIDLIDPGGNYDDPVLSVRGRAMLPRVRDAATRAWKAGVAIVSGTDTDYGPQSTRRIPDEVAELVQVGLPAMEAIKTATSVAARCLGVDQRTGALKAGLEADLIVVDRDPLADVGALRDVVLIINNGRIAVNRLAN
jgi:imidazolonepropionase-like amidohydrolase